MHYRSIPTYFPILVLAILPASFSIAQGQTPAEPPPSDIPVPEATPASPPPSSPQAQPAEPAPTTDGESDGELVFELETFSVNTERDYGYVAVDSLAGGRVNTPIKYTPSSISALTDMFIEDLGIENLRDALRWTPNVIPADPNAGSGFGGAAFHDWSFNYRGAGAGQQGGPGPTRNYFSFYQNADSYNVDRIEFLRGPNSLVFGLGTVGGTLSIYTKTPKTDRSFLTLTGIADSNGGTRGEFDGNRKLSDKFAIRVNAVLDDQRGWRENDNGTFQAITLAALYRFSPDTSLRVEGEVATRERTLIGTTISDEISGWDGSTSSPTWGADPVGAARTQPIQNAGAWGDWLQQYYVWVPGLGDNALLPWAGGYASTTVLNDTGATLPYAPYEGWYPEEIRLSEDEDYISTAGIPTLPDREWTYGSGLSDTDYRDLTVTLNHRFNDQFEGTAAVYRYEDDQVAMNYEATGGVAIDINEQLPNGNPNPNFGKPFADFFLSRQTQSRTVTEARIQLNYRLDGTLFNQRVEQIFSASVASKKVEISARQGLAQITNDTPFTEPTDWNQNMVWGRLYLDQPNRTINIPETTPDGHRIRYLPNPVGYWFDFDDTFELQDVALMSHTKLFDEALTILAGVRYDTYDEEILEYRRGELEEGEVIPPDRRSNESDSGTTYSVGGVYYFNWLGVFANYSENIQPPNPGSQPLLSGIRPSPEEGSGYDYGIRISTKDGNYYAQLSRYNTQSEGRLVENPVPLRGIWQRYYEANPDLTKDPLKDGLAYSDKTALDVTGWEFEVTANPTENIRVQASYAKPDAEVVEYYPDSRAYFAEYIDTWNEGIQTAASQESADALRDAIASAQDTLDQAQPGAIQPGLVKYTANIFVLYRFTGGVLEGLSIGGGASRTGRQYIATYDEREYWGTEITTANALIAYETTFFGYETRIALNIDNLFDEDDPIVTAYHYGYTGRDGIHVPSGYYFQAPRTFKLTARITF